MIIDKALLFSDAQAITSTAASTNVLDLAAADMGNGNPLTLFCQVDDTDLATGTSLAVAVQACDTVDGTFATVLTTPAILTANLTAGTVIELGTLPVGTDQFVRLNYTTSGTYTAGTVTAGIKLGANADSPGLQVT